MIIIAEGHPTVSRFISNKHIQILMALILFMFFIACGTLLTTFAIISNGAYCQLSFAILCVTLFLIQMCVY